MNAALLAGMLSAALWQAELMDQRLWAESVFLPTSGVCSENHRLAQGEACRFRTMQSISPSRAQLIQPAVDDAEWRATWWSNAYMIRFFYEMPRGENDRSEVPRRLEILREMTDADDWKWHRWPDPAPFR